MRKLCCDFFEIFVTCKKQIEFKRYQLLRYYPFFISQLDLFLEIELIGNQCIHNTEDMHIFINVLF